MLFSSLTRSAIKNKKSFRIYDFAGVTKYFNDERYDPYSEIVRAKAGVPWGTEGKDFVEQELEMPAGVFQPYAGVKTSFLIFKRKPTPKLDENERIWFFDMKGDGSSLSAAKKFGPQYKNDIPKLLELWLARHSFSEGGGKDRSIEKPHSWLTPVKDIAENDYILSANTYSPYNGEEEVSHRDPKEILKEIETGEEKLKSALEGVKKLL